MARAWFLLKKIGLKNTLYLEQKSARNQWLCKICAGEEIIEIIKVVKLYFKWWSRDYLQKKYPQSVQRNC